MDCLKGQERVFRLSADIKSLGSAVSLEGPKPTFRLPEWLLATGSKEITETTTKQKPLKELMYSILFNLYYQQ
jgi:hypothetical protein